MVPAYLNSGFSQINFHGQLLSHEHIRVSSLLEGLLQLLQLLCGEISSVSPLLAPPSMVVGSCREAGETGVVVEHT